MRETLKQSVEFGTSTEYLEWKIGERELSKPVDGRFQSIAGWLNAECKTSQLFTTKLGFQFILALYPNGIRSESEGFMSLYLRMIEKVPRESETDGGATTGTYTEAKGEREGDSEALKRNWVWATFRFFMYTSDGRLLQESALIKKPNKFEIHTGEYSWGYPKFMETRAFMKEWSFDKGLHIRCRVDQFVNMKDVRDANGDLDSEPKNLNDLQTDMLHLWESGNETDLTVYVNEIKYDVNECVLYCRAPVLLKHLQQTENPQVRILKIDDVEKSQIDIMWRFIYSNNLHRLTCLEDCIVVAHLGYLFHLVGLVEQVTPYLDRFITTQNAMDCMLHKLKTEVVLCKAIDVASSNLNMIYNHPSYSKLKTEDPHLIAKLVMVILRKMKQNCKP